MQKNKIYRLSTAALSIALILSLATSWKIQRDTQRELRVVIGANELLRKTLGEMTIAVTEKDKQIDRLSGSSCDGNNKGRPSIAPGPSGKKDKTDKSTNA